MAKSKRSKIKRKFKAEKRHKARPKAAATLKKVINMPIGGTGLPYVDAKNAQIVEVIPEDQAVETEVRKKKLPPLMNEHGNYPVWMNKKEMRRHINRRKRIKRNKLKATNK
ncbi:unnamed protein product [Hymenolepis diminuta]|uniref:GN3L_Grn1 domain-containing protein n=1 Tax=Hymenolepis diminuta TaxID=6216 RepID=A0A0R3SPT1_HYMDI|nr:unnamed protein product [Hymenolepis diminuta]VUZ50468.1 unnamed protein product [Hymenolepis diminuta]